MFSKLESLIQFPEITGLSTEGNCIAVFNAGWQERRLYVLHR